MAHAGGRPTKYNPIFIKEIDRYLAETGREQTELPTIEGFALRINVNDDTLVEWGKKYKEFSAALRKLKMKQKNQLINDGIYGGKEVNSTIVKLMLQNNHGMKERVDQTTNDKDLPAPTFKVLTQTSKNELEKLYTETDAGPDSGDSQSSQ
jgi:hypothetical protein